MPSDRHIVVQSLSCLSCLSLTFFNPTDCSTLGFSVFQCLLEFVQNHVHWVSDAIQSSHPPSFPSPPAFNLSQNQDLFQWVGSWHQFSSVPLLSHVQLFVTPWTVACQASLSFTVSWSLLRLMFIESVMPSNHLILCPLLSASGSFLMSQLFASGCQSIRASASASVLPMNIQDWFPLGLTDLISLQSKWLSRIFSNTIIWRHQFFGAQLFMAQHSHPYVTAGKTIALTRWTFVGKVLSMLFNTLSRFVIAFLPRSKPLLISWLQSPSTVILEPKKIKSVTVSIFPPSICHEVMGSDAMILVSVCWGFMFLWEWAVEVGGNV